MQQIPKIQKTHGQVTSALKKEAKKLGKNTNDVYNQFFREVFLHALMEHHKGWVLKGGSNIYCRIPGARQTKDLDLYRQDDPTSSSEAADSLVRSMQGHKVGPYTFHVTRAEQVGPVGTIESERINVTIIHGVGSRLTSFKVDVSGDLEVTDSVEPLVVAASYSISSELLPPKFRVYSYPVANQIADKVCAMYERHGNIPPGNASTRYHDLYDVALIARELTVTASSLHTALHEQRQVRRMTLPQKLILPDASWTIQYPKKAKNFGDKRWGLDVLDEALRVAGLLLDPILNGEMREADRTWDCESLLWK